MFTAKQETTRQQKLPSGGFLFGELAGAAAAARQAASC